MQLQFEVLNYGRFSVFSALRLLETWANTDYKDFPDARDAILWPKSLSSLQEALNAIDEPSWKSSSPPPNYTSLQGQREYFADEAVRTTLTELKKQFPEEELPKQMWSMFNGQSDIMLKGEVYELGGTRLVSRREGNLVDLSKVSRLRLIDVWLSLIVLLCVCF